MRAPHLGALLATLVLACSQTAASPAAAAAELSDDECMGPGSEAHDHGSDYSPFSLVSNIAVIGHQRLCPSGKWLSYDVAQLFTPPRVPWKLTRVCFALRVDPEDRPLETVQATVAGDVSLYPVSVASGQMLPGDRAAVAGFKRTIAHRPRAPGVPKTYSSFVPVWLSVDLSNVGDMVVWDKGVFVGVRFWSCGSVQFMGVMMPWKMRRASWQYNAGWQVTPYDAWLIRTVGHNHKTWHCNASLYNDGEVCDSQCGGRLDPDCDNLSLDTDCPNNTLFVRGFCRVPREWKCSPRWYNRDDDCDCECGTFDPDCDDQSLILYNCSSGQTCNYEGHCTAPGCGNGALEAEFNESCDGGLGCSNCSCASGYAPVNETWCEAVPRASKSDRIKVIISSTVGSVAGFLLLIGICAALLYARKVKNGPRKLNLPVEMNVDSSTLDTVERPKPRTKFTGLCW
eukprot:m51a1_g7246 hypothetical protein (455) ;mRNA; r:123964-126748